MGKFNVGDRVVCISTLEGKDLIGCIGTVRKVTAESYCGVEWDDNVGGYKKNAHFPSKEGHGLFVLETSLKHLH